MKCEFRVGFKNRKYENRNKIATKLRIKLIKVKKQSRPHFYYQRQQFFPFIIYVIKARLSKPKVFPAL